MPNIKTITIILSITVSVFIFSAGVSGNDPVKPNDNFTDRIANRETPPVYGEWGSFPDIPDMDILERVSKLSVSWGAINPIDKTGTSPLTLAWKRKMSEYPLLSKELANVEQARKNYKIIHQYNPSAMIGVEIRWDAVEDYELPPDHKWWMRGLFGFRVRYGQPKPPRYEMDINNPEYINWVGERCKAILDTGAVDFIFLDHITYLMQHGGDPVPFLKGLREKLGPKAVIIANTHFNEINSVAPYVNAWGEEEKGNHNFHSAMYFWEKNGHEGPKFNCWEFNGTEDNLHLMRYYTTLTMTTSDASFIYHPSDKKAIKWYDFWDVKIGKVKGAGTTLNGLTVREYANGTAVCNDSIFSKDITFREVRKSAATGIAAKEFTISSQDGDMFLYQK